MDKKFTMLKNELIQNGFGEKNFEYLYNAVKGGTKRELIFKNLTSDVRKIDADLANHALEQFYKINGGQFKYENRTGYLYSTAYLAVAVLSLVMIYIILNTEIRSIKFLIAAALGFIVFSYKFSVTIFKSIRGKHRD